MKRTLNQNNFYFALIADIHRQAMAKHITVENSEYMRNGLKENDENYPTHNVKMVLNEFNHFDMVAGVYPYSSAKLTIKQMMAHVEFIIKFVGEVAGIVPKFVEDDLKRLMEQAHGN